MIIPPILYFGFALNTLTTFEHHQRNLNNCNLNSRRMAKESSKAAAAAMTASADGSNNGIEDDPSAVWKSVEVATTFTDIRDSVPLAKEQIDLLTRIIRYFRKQEEEDSITFLDLGCGDGYTSRQLLQRFSTSKAVMVDFSKPMLETAKTKLTESGWNDRAVLLQADLSQPDWSSLLPTDLDINVVVSSFAIHHLTNQRKQELYQEIYDILPLGGIFLNLEHVASPDKTVEGIFDGAFVDSMYHHFQGTKSHVQCQEAVHYDLTIDEEANILVPVETQCDWLRNVGFQHVDCYFKFLILALFGGVKSK